MFFKRRKKKQPEDWEKLFDARLAALESVLGKSADGVFTSPQPIYMGGFADVLTFPKYVNGLAYVTSGLIGSEDQKNNELGNYELMICTRAEAEWAVNMVSRLARYTIDKCVKVGDTMDIGPALPSGSTVSALLFTKPDLPAEGFEVLGERCGILLCLGITPQELAACRSRGPDSVVEQLKTVGVFPFTELNRISA